MPSTIDNIKFTGADMIKLIGFVAMIGSMWYDLKTQQVEIKKDIVFLQYQIDELKGDKKQVAVIRRPALAILPDEIEIKTK